MKQLYYLIFFLLLNSFVLGQDDLNQKHPFLKLNAISFNIGANGIETKPSTQSFFTELAPNSTLLKTDLSTYTVTNAELGGRPDFGAFFNFNTYSKKKKKYRRNIEFRIGTIFQSNYRYEMDCVKTETFVTDTFSSNTTGMIYYKNRKTNDRYSFKYKGQKIGIDFANTFHTKQNKWLSFYAGYDVGVFYSFANYVIATYDDGIDPNRNRHAIFARPKYDVTEKIRLKDNFMYSASVPLGVVFRFVKSKRNTVYRGALNSEFRIGILEDKIGNTYYGLKYWYRFTVGLKFYTRTEIYKQKSSEN